MNYFLDTEFNGFGGELISLALIRQDWRADMVAHRRAESLAADAYYVFHDKDHPPERGFEPWVSENVVPILWDCPFVGPRVRWTPQSAAMDIALFLRDDTNPVIISDWPADIRYFCELIEFPDGKMAPIPRLAFRVVREDAYPTELAGAVQHNAWWDAQALRYKLQQPIVGR